MLTTKTVFKRHPTQETIAENGLGCCGGCGADVMLDMCVCPYIPAHAPNSGGRTPGSQTPGVPATRHSTSKWTACVVVVVGVVAGIVCHVVCVIVIVVVVVLLVLWCCGVVVVLLRLSGSQD